jgi:hypothetical protein
VPDYDWGSALQGEVRRVLEDSGVEHEVLRAADAWLRIGGDPRVSAARLVELLRGERSSRDAGKTCRILDMLARTGPSSPEILAEIAPLMNATDADVRSAAAYASACLGGDKRKATLALLEVRPDPAEARADRLFGLSMKGCISIEVMIELLESGDLRQRELATRYLEGAGAVAAPALPCLRRLRHDRSLGKSADWIVKRIEWELQHPAERARMREEWTR